MRGTQATLGCQQVAAAISWQAGPLDLWQGQSKGEDEGLGCSRDTHGSQDLEVAYAWERLSYGVEFRG